MSVRILIAIGLLGVVACKPSPDNIDLSSSTHPVQEEREVALVEGDVIVVEAKPLDDDDDAMNLCVTASSSAPDVLAVQRVKNKCRMFVISGKTPGKATVTFSARDDESTLTVDVKAP